MEGRKALGTPRHYLSDEDGTKELWTSRPSHLGIDKTENIIPYLFLDPKAFFTYPKHMMRFLPLYAGLHCAKQDASRRIS